MRQVGQSIRVLKGGWLPTITTATTTRKNWYDVRKMMSMIEAL